jgi:hypothetical protein
VRYLPSHSDKSWRTSSNLLEGQILFTSTGDTISHKNIVVNHPLFLYTWQWYVAQQHAEGIVAFPLQQWQREIVNMLLCTYIALMLMCSAKCGSGLQDQQTEPVQIHCKQLHSHISYACKLAAVCNILQAWLIHSAFQNS